MLSLAYSSSRYENIYQALSLIKDQIQTRIRGRKKIVIKVNFVSTINQLSATHPYAVQACVDFLLNNFPQIQEQTIKITEGAAVGSTQRGWENYGYLKLFKGYRNIEFFDLHTDQTLPVQIYNRNLTLRRAEIYKTIQEADFLISITPPKTHDSVIATLGIKNIAVGALKPSHRVLTDKIKQALGGKYYRFSLHQGYAAINLSLARLGKIIHPHLSIIDGFYGMEGNGPTSGSLAAWKIALASMDFLELDYFTAYLMGFKPDNIGYLYYLKEELAPDLSIGRIRVKGAKDWTKFKRKFSPHASYANQLKWKIRE